jgi:hypothetical protein
MFTGMDADHDLISAITPDVMTCLNRAGFFRKLDNVLCQADGLQVGEPRGEDYKLSKSVLQAAGFDPSDVTDILSVLGSQDDCCDCEILYSVVESQYSSCRSG